VKAARQPRFTAGPREVGHRRANRRLCRTPGSWHADCWKADREIDLSARPHALDWTRRAIAALAALAGLLCSGAAEAERGRDPYDGYTRVDVYLVPYGLYAGAGLVAHRVVDQSGGPALVDSGSGLALFAGVRLSQRLALELGWVATFHTPDMAAFDFGEDTDTVVLNGFTGDAKIFLGAEGHSIEPYVQGGIGVYLLDSSYLGTQSVGSGFQAGGGVDFHVGRHLDLGLRGLYRGIAMGPPDSGDNDTFISALGAEGNLTLRF
jgi:hypothetical protein